MKKNWKNIEGKGLRVDVGSTSSQAMSDSMPAEVLCFTTDGRIILNGVEFAPQADLIEDAINAEHPYIMDVVKTESYTDGIPQILLDSSDCTQDDINAFFDVYPFADFVKCLKSGIQLYARRKQKFGFFSSYEYVKLDILTYKESSETLVLRWFDGSLYNLTKLKNSGDTIKITKERDISAKILQGQIDEIKKLLQLA